MRTKLQCISIFSMMNFHFETTFIFETTNRIVPLKRLTKSIMKKNAAINTTPICQVRMLAISDAMSILSGKWKFHILGTLIEGNALGFMDLLREIDGIGTKMLSRELQDLEMNNLICRKVLPTKPVTVSYSITTNGKTLLPLINELANWGIAYRKALKEA